MKRRKQPSSDTSSAKPVKKEKGTFQFVKIFLFYLVIALVILGGFAAWRYVNKSPFTHKVIDTRMGKFGRVSIVDDYKNPASLRMLTYGKSILGGYWNVPGKPSCFTAFDVMSLSLYAHRDPKTALIVGLGTGILAKRAEASGVICDVVEIDPVVSEIAQHYFSFSTKGRIYNEDAADFIERTEIENSHKYDIIMHDIFSGDIDTSLFTVDVLKQFESTLAVGGVFGLNFLGYPNGNAAKSVYNTLSSIYEYTRCFVDQEVDFDEPLTPLTNIICFSSHQPVKFDIPSRYSRDANIYSFEWILTHHTELEVPFSKLGHAIEDGPILNSQNHQVLKFTEDMKSEFWLTMQGVFDKPVWDDILSSPVVSN